ncbi:MAG: FtsX-like permease family protein [Vicinamibacterales bacterium]
MTPTLVRALRRLLRACARALPRKFLDDFGRPMTRATDDLLSAAMREGPASYRRALLATAVDAWWRLPYEHLADLGLDLRYSMRSLRRAPIYATVAILSLAAALATVISIYGQLVATVYRDLPHVRQPRQLVLNAQPVSLRHVDRLRDACIECESVAAFLAPLPFTLMGDSESERVWGHAVSADYFPTLGVTPDAGTTPDWTPTNVADPAIVISHRLWVRRFGRRLDVIGLLVTINGRPARIAAVMPPDFLGVSPMLAAADIWVSLDSRPSLALETTPATDDDEGTPHVRVLARLRPDASVGAVEAHLDATLRQLEAPDEPAPADARVRHATLLPGARIFPLDARQRAVVVAVPVVMAGLTLWIACASVAVLLLARTAARGREIAIRRALGATGPRVTRQLVTETTLVTMTAAALGLALAVWMNGATDTLVAALPPYMAMDVRLGWDALVATPIVAALAGALLVAPAARQAGRGDVLDGLTGVQGTTLRPYRSLSNRNLLVLQQVAASVMLLLITGVVALGFSRLGHHATGFQPRDLATLVVDPLRDGREPEAVPPLLEQLADRLAATPGVTAASVNVGVAFGTPTPGPSIAVHVSERPGGPPARTASAKLARVGARFDAAVGLTVQAGTWPSCERRCDGDNRVAVNGTFASRTWPAGVALGQRLELEGRRYDVVAVVADMRGSGVFDAATPTIYVPLRASDLARATRDGVIVLVRTDGRRATEGLLRDAVRTFDPTLTVVSVARVTDQLAANDRFTTLTTIVYAGTGVFGLLLAVVGLAGVTAYATLRRTREVGIRVALGASPTSILWLVLREAAWLTVAGIACGVAGAVATIRVLGAWFDGLSRITQTSALDPWLMVGGPMVLALLTLASSVAPARRALKIDPQQCLRSDS